MRLTAALVAVLLAAAAAGSGCARIAAKVKEIRGETSEAGPPSIRVVVTGVEGEVAKNVQAHVALATEPCASPEWRVRRLLRRAEGEALSALHAFGYYRPDVRASLARHGDCWEVGVAVVPGDPVRVTAVRWRLTGEGADDPELTAVVARLPIREGDALRHDRYEQAKQAVASAAAERGYLRARYEASTLRIDPAAGTAVVEATLDTGPRFRFGALRIEQDALDPALVRSFFDYREGEPYRTGVLIELRRSLNESAYFSRVDVRPRTGDLESLDVPVDVTLAARKVHSFNAGAGLTTDTGPRLRLGYENRRLNRRGHRLSARTEASLIERSVTGHYRLPLADPRSEWLSFDVGYRQEDTSTSESEAFKLGARWTKKRSGGWLETRFVEVSREDFVVGGQSGVGDFVVPGVAWTRTRADDPLDPSRGHRLRLEVRGAVEGVLTDTSFLTVRAAAGWIRRLPWRDRLLLRGEVGATAVGRFRELPPSLRFFAGGDTSVRGYDFETIGPEDGRGRVIGGRYLGVGSFEYERRLTAQWRAAAFVDAGNAFDASPSDDEVKVGIGLGARWLSPIGPVRLDLAHPVGDDPLLRLHLRIGPDL